MPADGTKGDEVDLETVIQDAIDDVNEKRKSRKEDELGDGFADELLDAVAEVMSDDEPENDEEKGMKGTTPTRQKKSAGTLQKRREPTRKYSNIYMSRKGEPGGVQQKKIPAHIQVARAIKCLDVHGKGDPERAAYMARKMYGDKEMEREFKAMTATQLCRRRFPDSGGLLRADHRASLPEDRYRGVRGTADPVNKRQLKPSAYDSGNPCNMGR